MGPNSEPCSCSSAKRCQTCAVATKLAPASKVEFGQRRSLWDNAAAVIPLYFRFVLEMFVSLWYSCALSHGLAGGFSMVGNVGRVRLAAVAGWLIGGGGVATGRGRRQDHPGPFGLYVCSVSLSPSFCEASGERGTPPQQQCGARAYSFVVHGLWPQYEKGFPEFCQQPAPRLDRNIISSMLDLMPAPRLIFNEWDRHGTCSG